MHRKTWVLAILSFLGSCSEKEESPDPYFISFQLQEGNGKTSSVKIALDNPERMNGNDIINSDQASIGFEVRAFFQSPADKTITEAIHFFWSREVLKDDVTFASNGIPALKEPARINHYLPRTNLFEEQSTYFGSYIYEDTKTFCSAGIDPAFENTFRIIDVKQYTDDKNREAVDITAEFTSRYLSICGLGDQHITNGLLRTKILL